MIDELAMVQDNLRILKLQRESMLNDFLPNDMGIPGKITDALYEKDKIVRRLYSNKYRIEWINGHWKQIEKIVNKISNEKDRKEYIVFFAKNFNLICDDHYKKYPEMTSYFFEQLEMQRKLINEMIITTDKIKANFTKLCNLQKIQNSQWENKIKEYKNGGKE